MKQTNLSTAIVAALFAIRHNGIEYESDDLFEVAENQAVFLRMAKCVREPTASEIEDWEAQKQAEQQAATLYVNEEELPSVQPFATDSTETADAVTNDNQTATNMEADVVVADTDADTDHADVVIGEAVSMPEADEAEAEANEVNSEEVNAEEASKSTNPYDGWLKKDLNAELDKRGIEHDAKATNDVLEQLLIDDDAKHA